VKFSLFEKLIIKTYVRLDRVIARYKASLKTEHTDVSYDIHPSVIIHEPVHISPKENITIRENVSIAPFVQIWANEKVYIGKNTLIASHVVITSSTHDYSVSPIRQKRIDLPVHIGDDVWIGSGAIIFPGVTIGDGAVIGAGSVVRDDVPPNTIFAGNPAEFLKNRFADDKSK